jgi:transposase
MSSGKRRIFPEAFKREAVDRVSSSGLRPSKVALELGLHETVLRRWMQRFAPASGIAPVAQQQRVQPGLPSVADLTAENNRLRRENERLRMEREILKKTVTIFGAGAK